MASLLANLGDEHITTKIIKNLEMSSKTEEDKKRLSQIKILCSAIKKILDQNNKTADDEVVISPLDACSLL
jgi:molecular chaperone DnaK (HSP70)